MVGRSQATAMGRLYQVPGRTVEAVVATRNGAVMRL